MAAFPVPLKFLSRTIVEKGTLTHLWQACDWGAPGPSWIIRPGSTTPQLDSDGSCHYCYYRNEWSTQAEQAECQQTHKCQGATFPYIEMGPIKYQITSRALPLDGGGTFRLMRTAVFRQVKFEGQPLYIQLYSSVPSCGNCNNQCYWHAWRMANKRSWRQCGDTHACKNDGSAWILQVPFEDELYDLFTQMY